MKKLNFNIKDRKVLTLGLCLVVVCVFTLTIAYAALSVTLNITGNAEVVASTWDIHLDNVKITSGSVSGADPTITNGTTATFSTTLTTPGDFYEFTIDVVNDGSIDAMIDGITKTPTLTETQAKYLNYIIEYQNGESISTKQLVSANSYVRLKVRVEYRKDITASDLPTTSEILNLAFTVNYIQSDGTGTTVKDNGVYNPVSANGDINAIGTVVTIGDQQFYTIGTEGDNVKLLSMYNLYVGNSVDSDWNVTPLASPTGKQSELSRGWISGAAEWYGTTAFSNTDSTYAGSIVEGYVNNYKTILEEDYGVDVVEARLITKDELTSDEIGCSDADYTTCTGSSYPWIYSTSYWSGSAINTTYLWGVDSFGNFFNDADFSYDSNFGVRPVIIISKSNF